MNKKTEKKQSGPKVNGRILVLFGLIFFIVLLLSGRMVYIQVIRGDYYWQVAWEQWHRSVAVPSPRGEIYDCNQHLLAGNEEVADILVRPAQINDTEETARLLGEVLNLSAEEILVDFQGKENPFYFLRLIDKKTGADIEKLELPGIYIIPASARYYPNGTLAAQVLGVCGVDQGWSGLEYYYDNELRGQDGRIYFTSDNRGEEVPDSIRQVIPPQQGKRLVLTIDSTIQFIVERELSKALTETGADSAMALAVNPNTGEIMAAASKPDFDPAKFDEFSQSRWKLLPVTNTFEPGSTFKITPLLAILEEKLFSEEETIHCDGSTEVSGQRLGCWHTHGDVNYVEAFGQSCNIAFIRIGQRLGEEKLLKYIDLLGYGKKTGIDYPSESPGLVFTPESMGPVELATTSFGQGISVTPLQQVMTVSAIANGGKLMQPYFVKEIQDQDGNVLESTDPRIVRRPISQETAAKAASIMQLSVDEGIASLVAIEGYNVAGKSGTAQKVDSSGNYEDGNYILSFIGFAPVENPQVVLYIAVDGATQGSLFGTQIAGPVFKQIMTDVLKYLNVTPFPTDEE